MSFLVEATVLVGALCWGEKTCFGEELGFSNRDSKIEFTGTKPDGQHSGEFSRFHGKFDSNTGAMTVIIDMNSVKTDDEKLTGHLKSPDFFDVRKFPTARFVSRAIRKQPQGVNTHVIEGDLHLHGVMRPIALPASVRWRQKKLAIVGQFVIRRSEFGITYGAGKINEEVPIRFTLLAQTPTQAPPGVGQVQKAGQAQQGGQVQKASATTRRPLRISSQTSRIEFVGAKPQAQHRGGFKGFQGEFDTAANRIRLQIDMKSVFTDNPKLTGHLQSPDFFDVRKHPTATFVSRAIRPDKANGRFMIEGELTLHGVTRPIVAPAKIYWKGPSLVVEGHMVLRRSEFGMRYGAGQIKDEIPVTFHLLAAPQ